MDEALKLWGHYIFRAFDCYMDNKNKWTKKTHKEFMKNLLLAEIYQKIYYGRHYGSKKWNYC